MHHAISAVVMIATGLLFTSCTATVVQQWATSRPSQSANFDPPPNFPGEKRQALIPASATSSADECKPEQTAGPRGGGVMPRFSPVRKMGPTNRPQE